MILACCQNFLPEARLRAGGDLLIPVVFYPGSGLIYNSHNPPALCSVPVLMLSLASENLLQEQDGMVLRVTCTGFQVRIRIV